MKQNWLVNFLIITAMSLLAISAIVHRTVYAGPCDELVNDPLVQKKLHALPIGMQKLLLSKAPARSLPVLSPAKGMAQTDAYLSIPQLKEKVDTVFGTELSKYAGLIKKIQQKERDLFADYYVFYHAQPMGFLLLYDLEAEISSWINKRPLNDFAGLRVPNALFNINGPMLDFIEGKMKSCDYCYNFDTSLGMSNYLIAANVSLFGNVTWPPESTFYFFLNNNDYNAGLLREKMIPGQEKLLPARVVTELLEGMGFDEVAITRYLSRLKLVLSKLGSCQPKTGLLHQIFVPRSTVDKYAYLSAAFGMFPVPPEPSDVDPNILGFYSNGEYLKDLSNLKAANRPELISSYLEKFRSDPTSLGADKINGLQARLVATTDGLLNPESGIKMYQYIVMDETCKQRYKKELAALVKDMMYDWYKQAGVSVAKLDTCFKNNGGMLEKLAEALETLRLLVKTSIV